MVTESGCDCGTRSDGLGDRGISVRLGCHLVLRPLLMSTTLGEPTDSFCAARRGRTRAGAATLRRVAAAPAHPSGSVDRDRLPDCAPAPPPSTTPITPARRTMSPSSSRPTTCASNPVLKRVDLDGKGYAGPSPPPRAPLGKVSRVPVGSASRSIPAVRMFSPRSPGRTSYPAAASSSCSSDRDQVDLAQIGLGRVAPDPRQMLHGDTRVAIACDAVPSTKRDRVESLLAELVLARYG